jgi:3-hydroxy acid dehydrogenase/malonic semialdehyde reductase
MIFGQPADHASASIAVTGWIPRRAPPILPREPASASSTALADMRFTGTVLITGASAGIGEATARAFAAAGARLVLTARRRERLEALAAELSQAHGTECHLLPLDVRDRDAVLSTLGGLPAEWAAIDVLVNNAGLARGTEKVQNGLPAEWDEVLQTNVNGLLYVTRAVTPGMVERGRGHVVNLGSVAGHEVYPGGAVYCATKHAVGAITKGLRMDLLGTGVRVSTVDPGMVETEFSVVRFRGDQERADKVYRGMTPLTAADIADTVLWVATRPPHVNIDEIIIKPTDQASATQVHRTE